MLVPAERRRTGDDVTICKLCATGADLRQKWLGNADIAGWQMDASNELHSLCKGLTHCDCQHKGSRTGGLVVFPPPPRCSVCYRRTALTQVGGVVHWHKNPPARHLIAGVAVSDRRQYGRCPGSGRFDLVKLIAARVAS